ncbi:integrase arm-type DNA-binding domain-containing protein, partial [Rhizobium hidalgonense]
MPKIAKTLTDTQVRLSKSREKNYKISDGGGLYLLIKVDGGKYWRFDY